MTNPRAHHDIRFTWLTAASTECSAVDADEPQRLEFPIADVPAGGVFEVMPIGASMWVFRIEQRLGADMLGRMLTLAKVQVDLEVSTFIASCVTGTSVLIKDSVRDENLLFKPGMDLFRRCTHLDQIPTVEAVKACTINGMVITDQAMVELIGDDITQRTLQYLQLEATPSATVMPIPLFVSAPLRGAFSQQLTGRLRQLHAQCKVIEYLCSLAARSETAPARTRSSSRHTDRIRQLHEYLSTLTGPIPTMSDLSKRFGMSQRWLAREFEREYEQSIYAFIVDRVLHEAHAIIVQTSLPLKTLAQRVGYSNVNHFITAFKRKFGYTPGSLRS